MKIQGNTLKTQIGDRVLGEVLQPSTPTIKVWGILPLLMYIMTS